MPPASRPGTKKRRGCRREAGNIHEVGRRRRSRYGIDTLQINPGRRGTIIIIIIIIIRIIEEGGGINP
jgi:hypothetical protein